MEGIADIKSVRVKDMPPRWRNQIISLVEDANAPVTAVKMTDGSGFIGYPELDELQEKYHTNPTHAYNCTHIVSPYQVAQLGNRLDAKELKSIFG